MDGLSRGALGDTPRGYQSSPWSFAPGRGVPYDLHLRAVRSLVLVAAAAALTALASPRAGAAGREVSSLSTSPITIYGAKWCSACRALEKGLDARKIAYDVVDVDDNPAAFARARAASGQGGAIPLTSVVRSSDTVWIVGADVDAVDRAQRGE